MDTLKRTPLYEEHLKLGAKMVPFGGWEMPLEYSGIVDEHINVRERVGIFDVSHMGEIEIRGTDAVDFTEYIVANSVKDMKIGRVKYTPMCYPDGGEVDDLFVYKMADDFMLLVVNASNYEKDLEWLIKNQGDFKVSIDGKSFEYGEVSIQGPRAEEFLTNYFEGAEPLSNLGYFKWTKGKLFGVDVMLSRTGYTGEDGFEIYTKSAEVVGVWSEALKNGRNFGIKPAGLGARDTLRFEVAYWLYGDDIDETTNPLEAGQGFAVKLSKEDFIGKKALMEAKSLGIKRKLVGISIPKGGIPRHQMDIIKNNVKIGYVTSGNYSPTLKGVYAMGYVPVEYSEHQTELFVRIRDKDASSIVVPLPFVEPRAGKKKV
ncbi:MAG: glycine cleavage system aminomethyltransferase GcvT [Caldisericaceae bacterium]